LIFPHTLICIKEEDYSVDQIRIKNMTTLFVRAESSNLKWNSEVIDCSKKKKSLHDVTVALIVLKNISESN